MNTKLLVGSILSVVILILVSFTSVIGYRSIGSDVKFSPLFNIRSSKAIGRESKDIACDYVGKGEESILSIPKRDDKEIMIQKVIEIISKMNDETLERFIIYLINHLNKDRKFNDVNPNIIKEAIYQVRNSDKIFQIFDVETENKDRSFDVTYCCTMGDTPLVRFVCIFGLSIFFFVYLIFLILDPFISVFLFWLFPACVG